MNSNNVMLANGLTVGEMRARRKHDAHVAQWVGAEYQELSECLHEDRKDDYLRSVWAQLRINLMTKYGQLLDDWEEAVYEADSVYCDVCGTHYHPEEPCVFH